MPASLQHHQVPLQAVRSSPLPPVAGVPALSTVAPASSSALGMPSGVVAPSIGLPPPPALGIATPFGLASLEPFSAVRMDTSPTPPLTDTALVPSPSNDISMSDSAGGGLIAPSQAQSLNVSSTASASAQQSAFSSFDDRSRRRSSRARKHGK